MKIRTERVLYVVGAVVLGLALLKRLALLDSPLSYFDEGVLLTNADLVNRGKIVFRDFYSIYAPGIYYLIAGTFRLFGISVFGYRVLGLLVALALAALAGRHAGVVSGGRFSVLTAGIVLAFLIPLTNIPFAWFVALCLVFSALELIVSNDPRRVLAGGVVLGLSSVFRHDLFVYTGGLWGVAVVAGLVVAWRRPNLGLPPLSAALRALVLALALALVAWTVIVLSGGAHNVWRDLVDNVSRYIMKARLLPFPNLFAPRALPGLGVSVPIVFVRYFEAGVVFCFVGPLVAAWLAKEHRTSPKVAMRAVLLGCVSLAVIPQMSARTDGEHVALAVTPALLLISGAAERLIRDGTRRQRVLGAAAFAALMMPLPHAFFCVPRTRDTLLLGVAREGGVPQPEPDVVRARRKVRGLVERYTKAGDPIYVGTLQHERVIAVEMDLYFLLDRTGATRFMQFDPNLNTREDVQQEMVADIVKSGTKLAVLSGRPYFEQQVNLLPGSKLLDHHLADHFREIGAFAPYRVLLRRDVPE
jgi:hypothetical protein